MIEIRWRLVAGGEMVYTASELLTSQGPAMFVLECRTMKNIQELGIQEPIWGDWVQVPIEGLDLVDVKALPLGGALH